MKWLLPCLLSIVTIPAGACPNLAGHYSRQWDDGVVYYTVRQTNCGRVEIENTSLYVHRVLTFIFIPDGKPHGKGVPISLWVNDRLQIGQPTDGAYYFVDSAGNLHWSDGKTYPQCKGRCELVADKMK
jgi:hypothetical protein